MLTSHSLIRIQLRFLGLGMVAYTLACWAHTFDEEPLRMIQYWRSGNSQYVKNMLPFLHTHLLPHNAEECLPLVSLCIGLYFLFGNTRLARLLGRGLNDGKCSTCGYDLKGLKGPCPECGKQM